MQRLEEFERFLNDCTSDTSVEGSIVDCADAYQNVMALQVNWWSEFSDKAPPAILLLFLLTTLGGLYRYNLRMAGFYHARADALELISEGIDRDQLETITTTLAADKVEFRTTKTPIDTVTEITKAVIERTK